MTLLLTEPGFQFKEEAMIVLPCLWTFATWNPSFHEHSMDFKWRPLWQHTIHAVDGNEVSFNQEVNSSFTMNLLTLGPIPASAARKRSLHCMHCPSSSLWACQHPGSTYCAQLHAQRLPQTCLPPTGRSNQPHTQDWCDAWSGLMWHGAGRWSFRMISGLLWGPHAQNNTSCICWLTTEIPQLESHSSGLRCLHPCKKCRHHKKGKHFNLISPQYLWTYMSLSAFLPKARGKGTGHQGPNRRCNKKGRDN